MNHHNINYRLLWKKFTKYLLTVNGEHVHTNYGKNTQTNLDVFAGSNINYRPSGQKITTTKFLVQDECSTRIKACLHSFI
jgi:hypothetical protein